MKANPPLDDIGRLDGASATLARFVAELRYDDLPPATLAAFRRSLLDYLACAIAGAAMPVSQALRRYLEAEDLSRHAAVIGTPTRLSAANAALLNGTHAHALDFDDGYTQGSVHPAGAIFPAALAAAERNGALAEDIVVAVVAGYEVALRLAATIHPASARAGFHNTAVAGVFGAAAAVAAIMKLDAATTLHAFGLAGSFAGGIREYLAEGAEIKRLHPGKAARDGLLCAEFARAGITGPTRVLEGEMGVLRLFAPGGIRPQHLLDGLGRDLRIAQTYFKPYPCCRHYHAAIDAVRRLRAEHALPLEAVRAVEIGLYGVGVTGHDHTEVSTLLEAQMSAPCAIALALVDGDVSATQFLAPSVERPAIVSLMRRTTTRVDPECERIYPGIRSGVVTLEMTDGRRLTARVADPLGEASHPMTDADLAHKFHANCASLIGQVRSRAMVEAAGAFGRGVATSPIYQV